MELSSVQVRALATILDEAPMPATSTSTRPGAGDEKKMKEKGMRQLCASAANALLVVTTEASGDDDGMKEKIAEHSEAEMRVVAAIAAVYAEAARVSASVGELRLFLTGECSIRDEYATVLTDHYEQTREQLLRVVSCYSRDSGSIPELVDVRWKLSYTASSASGDRYFEPWYFVTFILDRPACEKYMAAKVSFIKGKKGKDVLINGNEIRFLCSYEDMAELVKILNDACKSAELASQG